LFEAEHVVATTRPFQHAVSVCESECAD
jgi:hypothetical protein